MDPLTIMAGATAVGGAMGLGGQILTNSANRAIAQNQQNFQEYMSNTAYQRAMADMKAAGINPMLVTKLGGASTPPGASATMENPAKGLPETASKIGQLLATKASIEMEREKTAAQVARDLAGKNLSDAQAAAIDQDTDIKRKRFRLELEGLGYDVENKRGEASRQAAYSRELAQKILNLGAQYEATTAGTQLTRANIGHTFADTSFTQEKTRITHTVADFVSKLGPAAEKSGTGFAKIIDYLTSGKPVDDIANFKGLDSVKAFQKWYNSIGTDARDFVTYLLRMAFTTDTK